MSKDKFTIVSEIERSDSLIQVRKYDDNFYDVGTVIDGVFQVKHPDCQPDDVIRALSQYCQNAFYKLEKV